MTEEHREEARKLKELWDARTHETQALFGERYEIGNQSAVGQFLRGDVPLSLSAARGFAKGLQCQISDFSLRLAKQASDLGLWAGGDVMDMTKLKKDEFQLVQIYRLLTADQKHQLQLEANNMYNETHPGPSPANPFAGKLPPSNV